MISKEKFDAIIADSRNWAKAEYGVTLPNLPVKLVDKIGDAIAAVVFSDETPTRPLRILFTRKILTYKYIDDAAIVKHEILHVVGWCLGQDYHDGSTWFENEAMERWLPNQTFDFMTGELVLRLPPRHSTEP